MFRQRFLQQQITKYLVAVFSELVLLGLAAVVLKGEDDGVVGRHEGSVSQRVDHVFEEDVGAHRHAVGYYWLFVLAFAVPAV